MYCCVGTGSNSVLRQVVIPIVNWDRCRNLNSDFQKYVKPTMICAGTVQGGKSSCGGDSGGPLQCKLGDRWYEYGLVNFRLTRRCAVPDRPTIYASVHAYRTWIQEKTGSLYLSVVL